MTPETYNLITHLSGCRFAPATPEKRFIRQVAAKPPDAVLTEAQLLYLGQIRYRYRKQLGLSTETERRRGYDEDSRR